MGLILDTSVLCHGNEAGGCLIFRLGQTTARLRLASLRLPNCWLVCIEPTRHLGVKGDLHL